MLRGYARRCAKFFFIRLCVFFFLIEARPEEIIVTIGAVEGLSAALLATVDPGDEVLLPTPTYSPHVNRVRLAGGRPVFVETKESAGFALDVEAMKHG